jgi:hypothetical protein
MRKTLVKVGLSTAAAVLLMSSSAYAQPATATASLNVTVNIAAKARLTLGAPSITFADQDPVAFPTLTASALTVDVSARTGPASNVTLTVLATGDLSSGSATIPVTSLAWTVGGAGFAAGASSSTTAQSVGTWVGSGTRSGSQVYSLPNSWNYAVGTYTTTLNYTLTAP